MTEFCHYQFYTNFALKNMHTKQSQGREGKSAEGERRGCKRPYEKSKDVKKQQTKSPRDGGNKSRQREIKKRFGFLRNVFYYSSGIK